MVDPGSERTPSYLMVTMGGRRCAVPAEGVLGVLRKVSINTFPAREAAFVGLARYGNDAVAVLDGATLFGLENRPGAPAAEPVVVMVRAEGGEAFGLLVEQAERIVTPGGEGPEQLPEDVPVCDPGSVVHDAEEGKHER